MNFQRLPSLLITTLVHAMYFEIHFSKYEENKNEVVAAEAEVELSLSKSTTEMIITVPKGHTAGQESGYRERISIVQKQP